MIVIWGDADTKIVEMKIWRDDTMLHGKSRSDQAGKTGGTLGVSVQERSVSRHGK